MFSPIKQPMLFLKNSNIVRYSHCYILDLLNFWPFSKILYSSVTFIFFYYPLIPSLFLWVWLIFWFYSMYLFQFILLINIIKVHIGSKNKKKPFLWLNNIPLCVCTCISIYNLTTQCFLFIQLVMGTHIVSVTWLLSIMLHWVIVISFILHFHCSN